MVLIAKVLNSGYLSAWVARIDHDRKEARQR